MALTTTLQAVATVQPKEKSRVRIEFLDGIRGLAALFVVIDHALRMHDGGNGSPRGNFLENIYHYAFSFFKYGRFAVVVFLVVSGYSLMLPVARSATGTFQNGLHDYFKRRFKRILPPYYVALVLTLLLIAVVPGLNTFDNTNPINEWNSSLPAFRPDILISHFLLIHNWSPEWSHQISAPLWSIPVEFQIYFLFPFLLIPLWRLKNGNFLVIAFSLAVGLLPFYLFPAFGLESPWFLALFAFGMVGATINFSRRPGDIKIQNNLPWGKISLFLTLVLVGEVVIEEKYQALYLLPLRDLLMGLAAISFIIYATRVTKRKAEDGRESRNWLLLILNSKWVLWLGSFSYSLYLIHFPLLAIVNDLGEKAGLSSFAIYTIQIFVGIPMIVITAYLFHLLFERPFLNRPVNRTQVKARD